MTHAGNAGFASPDAKLQDAGPASSESFSADPVAPATDVSVWVLYGHLSDGAAPQRIQLLTQPFTIGRGSENTIRVCNTTVSGTHAELLLAGSQLLLRDRNSTNGTLLNGRRIQSVEVVQEGDIVHVGNVMFTVHREQQTVSSQTVTSDDATTEAIAQVQFSTLMNRPGIEPYFQPIVDLASGRRIGYEVLTRSQFVGRETPAKMFRVAAQRTSEAALSRVCRLEGMRVSCDLETGMKFYLNTHPAELNDDDLLNSLQDLRERHPDSSIVLEVHESAVTSVSYLQRLRSLLDDLKIDLAYDDFGAGQARLTELIEVPPDVLKFDVQLVQGLPGASPVRRSTIAGLIQIVRDLNVTPLAEGVETQEEAEICRELGFELAQGYLFGRGERASQWIRQQAPEG